MVLLSNSEKWDMYYYAVEEYYENNGDIDIPLGYVSKEGLKLRFWLDYQRKLYKKDIIDKDHMQLLNDLDIKWNLHQDRWDANYELLKKYYEKNGNTNVKQTYETEEEFPLGVWVKTMRASYLKKIRGHILPYQINLLNLINFDWSPKNTQFLNEQITETNIKQYQEVLSERCNHILEDLTYESINEIMDNQDQIEKIIIKRLWR